MTATTESVKLCPVCGGPVRSVTRFDGYGHTVEADRLRHLRIRGLAHPREPR